MGRGSASSFRTSSQRPSSRSRDVAVTVKAAREGDSVVISVHNEGPAIPSDVQARLFLPYSRGGSGSPNGLGIGLFIVKQIADAHHASVAVSSAESTGTTFTFRMPI